MSLVVFYCYAGFTGIVVTVMVIVTVITMERGSLVINL